MTNDKRIVDETDLQEEIRRVYQLRGTQAVTVLKKRGIKAEYVPDRKAAHSKVLDMIPEGATVGLGDSASLYQIGIVSTLREQKGNQLVDPFLRHEDGHLVHIGAAFLELFRKALLVDVFITGVNAITMDGKLVSIDALGNRVAPTIIGPKKVILVVGANKVVGT